MVPRIEVKWLLNGNLNKKKGMLEMISFGIITLKKSNTEGNVRIPRKSKMYLTLINSMKEPDLYYFEAIKMTSQT